MTSFGPFSTATVAVLIAAVVAWWLPHRVLRHGDEAQRRAAAGLVLDALLVGVVTARLSFVMRWWPDYLATPRSLLALGDGGYDVWVGLPLAAAFVWWRSRVAHELRRPALAAIVAGVLAWVGAQGIFTLLATSAPRLPDLRLTTLDGEPAPITTAVWQPVVLNLWATWCPPCRNEMPTLARAARDYPQVSFVLVNQGEDAAAVRAYLDGAQLQFDHVLLDPQLQAMRAVGGRGLPTTLFFDQRGRLVDTHMGELSAAGLKHILQRRFDIAPAPAAAR